MTTPGPRQHLTPAAVLLPTTAAVLLPITAEILPAMEPLPTTAAVSQAGTHPHREQEPHLRAVPLQRLLTDLPRQRTTIPKRA